MMATVKHSKSFKFWSENQGSDSLCLTNKS